MLSTKKENSKANPWSNSEKVQNLRHKSSSQGEGNSQENSDEEFHPEEQEQRNDENKISRFQRLANYINTGCIDENGFTSREGMDD